MPYLNTSTLAPDHLHDDSTRPNPASAGRRLKRNVRIGNRRTTILLRAYVWDCLYSMLLRRNVTLDACCNMVETACRHSNMASSARLVVLAYFQVLEQLNTPPFVNSEIVRKQRGRHAPVTAGNRFANAGLTAYAQMFFARQSVCAIAAPGAVIWPHAAPTDATPSARIRLSSSRIIRAGSSGPCSASAV